MRTWVLVGVTAGILALTAAGAVASDPTAFPVAGLGDVWFQADYAGFLDPERQAVTEFYVRVANNQIRFEEDDDGRWVGRVFIRVEFLDEDEDGVGEASRQFEFGVGNEETALSSEYAQVLLLRESVDPRTRFVRVHVDDMNSRKRGLLYVITGKRRTGEAVGMLEPPPFTVDPDFATSDLQFAWSVEPGTGGGDFEKNGLNVVPNPGRTYGLLQSEGAVYYEVYDRSGGGRGLYELRHQIVRPDGSIAGAVVDTVAAAGSEFAHVVRFDVSRFATGQHRFRVVVHRLADGAETVTERSFGVVWGMDAWARSEEDILNEARVLLSEDEYERFRELPAAEREVFLSQFWASHDPSPELKGNELRDEFLRRVRFANEQFEDHGMRGMLTDRGRIYIRFGEPDEIERELLPTKDRQLDQLAPTLEDENPAARTLGTSDEVDVRPFEIWTYTGRGAPLFPEREFGTSMTGLRFIFVDETGTGHYVLRYTKDFIDY